MSFVSQPQGSEIKRFEEEKKRKEKRKKVIPNVTF
jgi:hypothetical protein